MRIALLAYDLPRYTMMKTIDESLSSLGHRVKIFMEHDSKVLTNAEHMTWSHCKTKPLDDFKPDKVIIFNGYAEILSGATSFIRKRYETLFVEQAWLPQRGHIYIDKVGLGARSSIAQTNLSMVAPSGCAETFADLLKLYEPKAKPAGLPENYVLLPMQLENDTSIRLDSPYFKTMESFVAFVREQLPHETLVIKTHPYAKTKFNFGNTTTYGSDVDINTLSYYSKAVVGINSTSLIEALVHMKPVVALGDNVLISSGVYANGPALINDIAESIHREVSGIRIMNTLCNLKQLQFSRSQPLPEWVVNYITT